MKKMTAILCALLLICFAAAASAEARCAQAARAKTADREW